MTFDRLVLHNFGVYKGRHGPIELAPPSENRPVVLIGGLNGAGKTTLLDALQLVLYGKLARTSNRGNRSYEAYLRSCINRDVRADGGAAIELEFHHRVQGATKRYRVRRTWASNGSGVKESVDVKVRASELDGWNYDAVLSNHWAEYAEEFIPARLANLFFFDGEKIEAFADVDNAAALLKSAVHSLLGLDLVDQLHLDLRRLESEKVKALRSFTEDTEYQKAKREKEELERFRADLTQKQGQQKNVYERTLKRFQSAEERYNQAGGSLLEQRERIEKEKEELSRRLNETFSMLRELAAGSAPLLLTESLLHRTREQLQREEQAREAKLLNRVLQARDRRVLELVKAEFGGGAALDNLKHYLDSDRRDKTRNAREPCFLDLNANATDQLQDIVRSELPQVKARISDLLTKLEETLAELDIVDRTLMSMPDAGDLQPVIEEREALRSQCEIEKAKLEHVGEEIQRLEREIGHKERELTKLIQKNLEAELEHDSLVRFMRHSARVRESLREFRQRVVSRHLERIQGLVLGSFKRLLRKQTLISTIRVEPESFRLELFAEDGRRLETARLSAGERQILAVSLLWGLARATGRSLPAVIDTPLGRLDSSHRNLLLSRYFPAVSHQVLLLSTDEEIHEEYLEKLRPAIGWSYLLEYSDTERSTRVKEGYFSDAD